MRVYTWDIEETIEFCLGMNARATEKANKKGQARSRRRGAGRAHSTESEPVSGPERTRRRGAAGAGTAKHYGQPGHDPLAGQCVQDNERFGVLGGLAI